MSCVLYNRHMTKPMNTEAIEAGTGASWGEWVKFLDGINARELTHKQIAEKVHERGATHWWAQTVAVAYEQHIGRRLPGQDDKGDFAVSVTKTFGSSMDATLDAWIKIVWGRTEFNDVPIKGVGEISKTDKWRYWRAVLGDNSHVVVTIYEKVPAKVGFTITHERLKSDEAVELWRAYWKEFLTNLK